MSKWVIILIAGLTLILGNAMATDPDEENLERAFKEYKPVYEEKKAQRDAIKKSYPELFEQVSKILFDADPIGISNEENYDEYEPEAGTIIPRLIDCKSANDAKRVIHQEFVSWFGSDIAGPEEQYTGIANDVWKVWNEREFRT